MDCLDECICFSGNLSLFHLQLGSLKNGPFVLVPLHISAPLPDQRVDRFPGAEKRLCLRYGSSWQLSGITISMPSPVRSVRLDGLYTLPHVVVG
jgi:hypothetical protein